METSTSIAAVVVTYNRCDMLKRCIASLQEQTVRPDALLVIDNASTDGTEDLCTSGTLGDLPLIYERLPENRGGAGGFKHGIGEAHRRGFDYCWIMDDDVLPDSDALEELLAAQRYLTCAGVRPSFLASTVTGSDGEVMNVPVVSPHFSSNGYPDWAEHLSKALVRIEIATFVSLLIPSYAIKEVGLPIADFFMWGDDSEYTKRLTTYVGPAFLCGKSHVTHLRSVAAPIGTVKETDPTRIAHRRRATRNGLITSSYYGGAKQTLRGIARNARDCLRVLANQDGLVMARLKAITGGTLDFCTHRYGLEDLGKLDKSKRRDY